MAADRAWLKRGSWPANLRHVICQSLLSLWRSSTISSSATTKHDKPFTSLAEIKPRTNPKTPVKMARIPSLISNSFVGFSAIKQKGNSVAKRTAELETLTGAQNRCGIAFPALGPRCNMKQERKRAPESSNFSCDSGKWGWEEGGRGGGWNKTRKKNKSAGDETGLIQHLRKLRRVYRSVSTEAARKSIRRCKK